ncbi:MAG: hypothetical protein U9Q79_10150 [Candidatus Hydrogenedentes bacterium]|nr:hypothetical protein [Candidatus Hydrogenedentota bacterium]
MFALLVLLVLFTLLLATGYPQARLIEYAIHRATGLKAQVKGVGVYPALRIEFLTVYQNDAPVLSVEDLMVAYSLMPEDGRHIRKLVMERVAVRMDSELVSHIESLTASSEPTAGPPLGYVPREVMLRKIETRVVLPSVIADVEGILLTGRVDSLQRFSFELVGEALTGRAELPLSDYATSLDGGSLEISGSRDGASGRLITCRVSLPNLAEIDASASAQLTGTTVDAVADISDFRILGEGEKTVLVPGAAIPVTVGSLNISDAHLEGTYALLTGRFMPSTIRLAGNATGVRVGAADAAWYMDTVDVNTRGTFPDYKGDFTLNDTLPLELRASFQEETIIAALDIPPWPRKALLTLLPPAYQPYLDSLPSLHNVSLGVNANVQYPNYQASLTLTPGFDGASPFAGPLRAEAKGNLNQPEAIVADVILPLDQGSLSAVLSMKSAGHPRVEAMLDAVDVTKLATITAWAPLPKVLARPLSGTVSARWDGQEFAIETDLEGPEASWGTDLLQPLPATLDATLRWNPATGAIRGDRLMLKAGDGLTVQGNDWRVQLDPLEFEGIVTGKAGLPGVSPMASELGIGAEVRFETPVTLRDNSVAFSLDAASDYFQFGDFSFYQAPFHATGRATVPLGNGQGTFRDFELTYGDSSSLTVSEGTLALEPFRVDAPYALTSNLHCLVDAGLIESIEGTATATGKLTWHKNLVITSDYRLEAPLLVTGGSTIAFGGITAEGNLRVDQSLSGLGQVNAVQCALAGFPFKNIATPLSLDGAHIRMESLSGELFGGVVKGNVALDLSGDIPVVQAGMQLRNIDIEQFAGTMIPPEYGLEGLAQGLVKAELTTEGLEDATVKLVSSGDFALNKALLQKILLEYLSNVPGAETIERIGGRVLGEDEWRPFDSASLDLAWADDKMVGNATLRSVDLNLKIDLNIDEPSIRQLLELQQQARLENIENIRTQPVEQQDHVQ